MGAYFDDQYFSGSDIESRIKLMWLLYRCFDQLILLFR